MTMAESAVEDAAAAPPGPAKPPPPSCTNNNTLAATANRNHRPSRKRRRLNQVLDDLQAHKILPSEGEVPTRFDATSLASEEEEDVFGSPRSTSRSASENASQPLSKRLKGESLRSTTTDEETPSPSHLPYQHYPHYLHHHEHHNRRHHPANSLQYQNNNNNNSSSNNNNTMTNNNNSNNNNHHNSHNTTSGQHHNSQSSAAGQNHHPSTYHRPPQKFRGCACVNCVNPPVTAAAVAAAAAAMLLPSPTSPLTPLTPLTALTPMSLTPLTPVSPSSYSFEHYLNTKYLPASDVTRKRSHSDSDVPGWEQRPPSSVSSVVTSHTPRSGSLESDATSPQESPLDLSMKNLGQALLSSTTATSANNRPSALQLLPPGIVTRGSVSVPVVRGDVASPTTKESVAVRYNLEVSPVVEEMPPGADVAYVCPVCGQMFSLHDRLAKHMASRHRRQGPRDASAKAYRCDVCKRSFARSDMLTRHMRLHTGVKPYTCKVCSQVFSRSDHLSTHQRTHTGEKPYKCPQCVYAACRRDMITRHLRTHAKMGDGQQVTSAKCEGIGAGPESPSYGIETMSGVVKME